MEVFELDVKLDIGGKTVTPLKWTDRGDVVCRIRAGTDAFAYGIIRHKDLVSHMADVIELIGNPPVRKVAAKATHRNGSDDIAGLAGI